MNPQDPSPHTSAQPQPDANNLAPAVSVGTEVEVIVNDRNRTRHRGVITSVIWHHNAKTWHYRLICKRSPSLISTLSAIKRRARRRPSLWMDSPVGSLLSPSAPLSV